MYVAEYATPTETRRVTARGAGAALAMAAFAAIVLLPLLLLGGAWLTRALTFDSQALAWALPSGRGLRLLGNSLTLATAAAVIGSCVGVATGLWICLTDGWLQRFARGTYLLPLLVPPYLHALAWMSIAGRRQLLDQVVAIILGPDRLTISAYGLGGSAIVLGLALSPIATLLIVSRLQAIEPELIEQGYLLRPAWATARRVLFPLIVPGVIAGAGLIFVLALVEYGVPSVLQFNVFSMEIYALFSQDNDPVRAAATSLALLAPGAAVLAGTQWVSKTNPLKGTPRRPVSLPMSEWPLLVRLLGRVGVAAGLLAVVGPVVVLLGRAASPANYPSALSVANRELMLTVMVAGVAATCAAPIATSVAAGVLRRRAGTIAWLACALPLAIPGPLAGVAWVYAGNSPALDWAHGTPLLLILTHLSKLLPIAVFAAATQVRRVDPLLLEAAELHPVGTTRLLHRIHLPLYAPAMLLAWVVVFVLSLGELGASLMVAPPGQSTLPMTIYNLMHYGASETVAALALVTLGVAAAVGTIALRAGKALWPWTV